MSFLEILFDLLILTMSQQAKCVSQNISQEIKNDSGVEQNSSEEMQIFFSNTLGNVEKNQKSVKKIEVKREINEHMEKFKEIRINNTLASFDKNLLKDVRERLDEVRNYILDINYNFVASLVIDGVLKAAGGNYLVFVYNNAHDSDMFNDNLDKIELLFETIYNKKYKLISTSSEAWEIIRDEFNNKKKVYEFIEEKEENEKNENTESNFSNEIETDFGNLISVE